LYSTIKGSSKEPSPVFLMSGMNGVVKCHKVAGRLKNPINTNSDRQ
jgi:hypothetical protein